MVLLPDVHFGVAGPGCHFPSADLARDRLYGWEVLLATFFIMVMFAADFVRPGHGDAGPLAAGLALYAILSTGEVHWAGGVMMRVCHVLCVSANNDVRCMAGHGAAAAACRPCLLVAPQC